MDIKQKHFKYVVALCCMVVLSSLIIRLSFKEN